MKKFLIAIALFPILLSCDKENSSTNKDILDLTPKTRAEIQDKINSFSFRLYDELSSKYSDDNMVISPISCSNALSLTGLGAQGKTFEEISSTLGLTTHSNEEVGSYAYLQSKQLKEADDKVSFISSNSLWIKPNFPVKEDYKSKSQTYYDAYISSSDFTAAGINKWIEDNTNGMIKNAALESVKDVPMVFVNAMCFNSPWSVAPKKTSLDFTDVSGGTSMRDAISFNGAFSFFSDEQWQYIALPFGKEGVYQMEIFAPKQFTGIDISKDMANIRAAAGEKILNATVPVFDIYTKSILNDPLRSLGIKEAFSEDADFGQITDMPLHLGVVIHDAAVRIDERGGVGAASTIIEAPVSSEPENIAFNRPFVFSISEKNTGAVLFIGHIVK